VPPAPQIESGSTSSTVSEQDPCAIRDAAPLMAVHTVVLFADAHPGYACCCLAAGRGLPASIFDRCLEAELKWISL
jgi:hypothetical protein